MKKAVRPEKHFNRQAGSTRAFKPLVAQLKTGPSPQSSKRSVAPPVHHSNATPMVAQLKMANGAVNRKLPVAPPVYRPQAVPKVLQAKSSSSPRPVAAQAPRATVASPAYRPGAKLMVQPKAISPLRKAPTPPPAYRPEQKNAPVPAAKGRTHRVGPSNVPVLQRHIAIPASRSVVQRAEERKIVFTPDDLDAEGSVPEAMEWEDLSDIARDLNKAPTGDLDGRHVQAVTLDKAGRVMVFTQKWRTAMGDVRVPNVFEPEDKDYVVRNKKDDHLHAEMLMISSFLQGQAELPEFIGVSKAVCARCSVVLNYFKIPHYTDGQKTDSWLSPWYHAKKAPPKALKGKIPKTVRREREYPYKDSDWK